tara:strand:- start:69 stop:680 length:612 start_codon:yes stop_codon:yes gene_type:complete
MLSLNSYTQTTATIDENGKKVILKSDGTWDYKEQIKTNFEGTGIWNIRYFVDEFGDKTNQGFITNKNYISGSFSNSATSNSSLNVQFIISNQNRLAVKLFEYASNNPVKAYIATNYIINIKDSDGARHSLNGIIYEGGDRIFIEPNTRRKQINKFHQILMKGGEISMNLKENNQYGGLSSYSFKFKADGYKNVFNELVDTLND